MVSSIAAGTAAKAQSRSRNRMQPNTVIFTQLSAEELKELVQQAVQAALPVQQPALEDPLLTVQQACQLLHISRFTIWEHTRRGTLTAHRLGKRVFYKKGELEAALTTARMTTAKKGTSHK